MEVAVNTIYHVALLFIMMVPGVILKKTRLSPDGFGKGISNLVLYIAQPALVFIAYLRPYDEKILINAACVLVFSAISHIIFAVVATNLFKKAPDARRRMLRFATIFSNSAFMGIPLISVVLDREGMFPGATVYASIYNITFNIFLWSLGVKICTDDRDVNANGIDDYDEHKDLAKKTAHRKGASPLKALYHPVTIAAALGLAFFLLQNIIPGLKSFIPSVVNEQINDPISIANCVPRILTEAFTMLKGLVAPLSMVVIGLRLADMKFDGMLKDKYMYLFLALRHVILPLAVIGVAKLSGLFLPIDPVVGMVCVILAATPAATSATMFAEMYDCDADYVSRLVAVSTLLSILTMPVILLLM